MTKKWSTMGVSDKQAHILLAISMTHLHTHYIPQWLATLQWLHTQTHAMITWCDGTCTCMWFPRYMHVIVCSFDPNPYPTQWQPYSENATECIYVYSENIVYWGVHSEIWELFSLPCPYAAANAGAPPKQLFCCMIQERLTIELHWWDVQLLLQLEISMQQWESCLLFLIEMAMLMLIILVYLEQEPPEEQLIYVPNAMHYRRGLQRN